MLKRSFFLGAGLVVVLSLVMLWSAGCSGATSSASAPTTAPATPTKVAPTTPPTSVSQAQPSAANGQQLYQENCASCHKADGSGGIKIGDVTSADLRKPKMDKAYHGDINLIKRAILDGKDEEGEDLDNAMPRWAGKLTDQQASDIAAYLQTLTGSATGSTPSATGSTPQAQPASLGQQLYQANCVSCHKADGSGGVKVGSATAADLRKPKMDKSYKGDTALVRRAILNGKDEDGEDLDNAMPRWAGKLTDQQADDIAAYLQTLK